MADLTYALEVALGGTLTDVTDLVDGIQCGGGRQREYDTFAAGTCQFTVDDRTGDYLPDAGGTYSAETWVGREVKVTVTVAGVSNVIWRGHVEDVDIDVAGFFFADVSVTAAEPTALLGRTIIDTGTMFSSELSSTRISNVLNLAEVDSGYFVADTLDIGTGEVTLQAESDAGGNTMQYLDLVARSEGGRLYTAHGGPTGGVLTFRARNADTSDSGLTFQDQDEGSGSLVDGGTAATTVFVRSFDGGDAASTYGAGDDIDGGDASTRFRIPFERIDVQYGSERLHNRITYTRDGGTAQTAEDTASQARYGIRTVVESGLLMATDAEALSAAQARLADSLAPQRHVEGLTVLLDVLTDDQAALVCGLSVGERINVIESPPGYLVNGTINDNVRIERVTHRISTGPSGSHTVQFAVSTLGDEPAKWDEDAWDAPDALWGI